MSLSGMKTQDYERVFQDIARVPESSLEFSVGIGLWGDVRDWLEGEVFAGRPIRWREGRGWITRRFTVVGPPAHVQQILDCLKVWAQAFHTF